MITTDRAASMSRMAKTAGMRQIVNVSCIRQRAFSTLSFLSAGEIVCYIYAGCERCILSISASPHLSQDKRTLQIKTTLGAFNHFAYYPTDHYPRAQSDTKALRNGLIRIVLHLQLYLNPSHSVLWLLGPLAGARCCRP